ncbi:hypothetical protein D3C71_1641810 [compost metagenome]
MSHCGFLLLLPELLGQACGDLRSRNAAEADCGEHILDIVEREFFGRFQQLVISHPFGWFNSEPLQLPFDRLASLLDVLLALLLLEPLLDLASGMRRLGDLEPIPARPVGMLRGQDFDNITGLEFMIERDNPSVHLRADGAVADLRMNAERKIKRHGARRQLDDFPFRGEHEDEVGEKVHF